MVELNFQVDPTIVEEPKSFTPLPDGRYAAMITGASVGTSSKDDRNKYLCVEFTIEQNNSRVWVYLNLWNKSDDAVRISKQNLNDICLSLGLTNLTDTDQIIGKRLLVDLTTKPAQGNYAAKNEIRGYKSISEEKSAQPSPQVTTQTEVAAPTPAPQQPSAPQEKNPWE
tara:strand:- start:505 stop:1011 length:507 start_codon:yes stop_codon:yes gene_type:complete